MRDHENYRRQRNPVGLLTGVASIALGAGGILGFVLGRRALRAVNARKDTPQEVVPVACVFGVLDDHPHPNGHNTLLDEDHHVLDMVVPRKQDWQTMSFTLGEGMTDEETAALHDHEIILEPGQLQKLSAGEPLEVYTTVDEGHAHLVYIDCGPAE